MFASRSNNLSSCSLNICKSISFSSKILNDLSLSQANHKCTQFFGLPEVVVNVSGSKGRTLS